MLAAHLSIVLALQMAGKGLEVRSGTDCPSGAAISAKLAPLLPAPAEAGDVAWVDVAAPEPNQPPALRVRLLRPDGGAVADRRLTIQGGCDEMADTVATVLAAWESPPTAPPAILLEDHELRAEPAKVEPRHTELWLGAAGGAGFVGGIVAAGNLELVLENSHLLARAAMTGQTARQRGLGPGDVVWRRSYGSLGLGWQSLGPASRFVWQGSVDVGVLLGWLTASGRGFTPNAEETVFEYGFGAGLRGQRKLGNWALWLEARANLWPSPERVVLTGSPSTAQLPKLDVLASLGVSRVMLH